MYIVGNKYGTYLNTGIREYHTVDCGILQCRAAAGVTSPRIFEWGMNRRQVANQSPKYPKNRKMRRIWVTSFSNLEGTSPPNPFTAGTRPLRPLLSTPVARDDLQNFTYLQVTTCLFLLPCNHYARFQKNFPN